ncbi:hypothetical protein [Nitrosospira sp. Nsp1]|uniref:hypothetical protein n=1 Tax=Nitrosospira sp. Nsp1 TaxID=136547 RepID=UPI0008844D51|nr:hypothetical protein [Nitrosospira sp. Nsp1]SCX58946.1 hypothetical protein SAMN05720354_12225 [Nitrosospira sp. Nsp1]
MPKIQIAIVAIAMLVGAQVNAQYYEPADGQYYSTPSRHQYQQQTIPHYHLLPQNRMESLENYAIESRDIAVAGIYRQRLARMTPEQVEGERYRLEVESCHTDRFVLGYATLGLYGLYSMAFNDPCNVVVAGSTGERPSEDAELTKKARAFDDLSAFVLSTGMTQQEFTSWLEAMRLSHQDPAQSSAIVKSILESPR